jgi:hypothetical protein
MPACRWHTRHCRSWMGRVAHDLCQGLAQGWEVGSAHQWPAASRYNGGIWSRARSCSWFRRQDVGPVPEAGGVCATNPWLPCLPPLACAVIKCVQPPVRRWHQQEVAKLCASPAISIPACKWMQLRAGAWSDECRPHGKPYIVSFPIHSN